MALTVMRNIWYQNKSCDGKLLGVPAVFHHLESKIAAFWELLSVCFITLQHRVDWPVSLPCAERDSDRTQIRDSLAGQAKHRIHRRRPEKRGLALEQNAAHTKIHQIHDRHAFKRGKKDYPIKQVYHGWPLCGKAFTGIPQHNLST